MRTVLITGGSRGIGRKVAEKLLLDGNRLILGMRDPSSIKGSVLDPDISGHDRLIVSKYEAKNEASAKKLIDITNANFGALDSLICCAGIFNRTSLIFEEGEQQEIEELLQVNLMAPWHLTRAAWPYLKECKRGRIVMMCSMSGKRSKGKLAGYSVSKFALMGLCQTIRNEGWNEGIRVTAICPGWVNTDMASGIKSIPQCDMTQPEDIGDIASLLLKLPNSTIPFEVSVNCCLET